MKKLFLLLFVFVFLFSCAQKAVVTTEEEMPVPEEEVAPVEEVKEVVPEEEPILPVEPEEVEEVVKEMPAVSLEEILQNDINFDFDRYEIKENDKETLRAIADWLIGNPGTDIRIEGHCDERGTNEYNLGLGDRRANATKSYLMMLGVPSSRMRTISYGEERPLCTQSEESCWWRNRRAHFTPAD